METEKTQQETPAEKIGESQTNDQSVPQESSSEQVTETEERESEIVTFPITIKTCGEQKSSIQLQVSPSDNIQDIKQYLLESLETCFITQYHFQVEGKKLNDFNEVQDVPEIKADSVVEMIEAPYDERSLRLHVKRFRELLSSQTNSKGSLALFSQIASKGEDISNITEPKEATKDGKPNTQEVTLDEKDIQVDADSLLSNYYSSLSTNPPVTCVKSITYSGWNPPPGYRKLQGDLVYLEVATLEGRVVHVTGSTNGFFINATNANGFNPNPIDKPCYSHSLPGLLGLLSPSFKKNFQSVLNNLFQKHPFEVFPDSYPRYPWTQRKEKHTFDLNRAEDGSSSDIEVRGQMRDWNEEYQTCKELARETIQERIIRDRSIYKVNVDFVEAATKGAIAIIDKTVMPINPLDPEKAHMYIYNNIFFSYAMDGRDFYKEYGGDKAAYVSVNNDLKGIRLLNNVDVKGLYTLATAIIDYRGYRIVAQSIIPGILQREQTSNVVYGSIDNGKSISSDAGFHELMGAVAKQLHIKENTVIDAEGKEHKLFAAVESKGIIGTDTRKYILDLVRFTPRDSNFPEKNDILTVLRPELVQAYYEHLKQKELRDRELKQKEQKEKEAKEKESKDAQSDPSKEPTEEKKPAEAQDSTNEQPKQQEQSTEEAQPQAQEPEIQFKGFNPNSYCDYKLAGTPEELAEDQETVKAMGSFLKDTIIPILVDEFMWLLTLPIDGHMVTSLLHNHGVNIRYLGYITQQVEKNVMVRDVLLREMVSRAAKHILRSILRDTDDANLANVISHFLNCLVGSSGEASNGQVKGAKKKKVKSLKSSTSGLSLTSASLWEQLTTEVKERFQYDLPERTRIGSVLRSVLTLRSVCQKVGIQVEARDYDFTSDSPLQPNDILDLFPVVKHCDPETSDGHNLLEAGKTFLAQGRLDIAYELLTEALAIFHQVYGPLHRESASCYSHLSTVMYHAKDIVQAIDHQQKATVINERVLGLDHPDTVQSYSTLGLFYHQVSKPKLSLSFTNRALYLTRMLAGNTHPDTATIYTNLAMILQDLQHGQLAVKYLMEALKCYEMLLGPAHLQTAAIYHAIALSYSQIGQFKEALTYEKKNYAILHEKLGDADIRTVESNICLKQFTSKAVQAQIETKKTQRDITSQLSQAKLEKLKVSLPSSKDVRRGTTSSSTPTPVPMGNRPLNEVLSFINGPKSGAGKSFAERNKKSAPSKQ